MVLRYRQEYLEAIRSRYRRSSRKDKAVILDEFCAICGYNRKYAIRLLKKRKTDAAPKRKPGPRSIYQDERLLNVLKRIREGQKSVPPSTGSGQASTSSGRTDFSYLTV